MNETPPTLAALGRLAHAEKERTVRRGEEVAHFADVYRAGKRILRVAVPNADDLLNLLYNVPAPLCADHIAIAADVWDSKRPVNPITGEEWRLGDMGRIADHDDGVRRGLVGESIMLLGFERDGTLTTRQRRYHHDRQARTIRWTDGPDGVEIEAVASAGRFPGVARDGFARPTAREAVFEHVDPAPEGYDVDDLLNRFAVSWVLKLPREWRIIEGPKGRPLDVSWP